MLKNIYKGNKFC